MGSIRRIEHPSGKGSWQARWRGPTGHQRSRNFARRVDAERHLTLIESQMLIGDYVDPRSGKIEFAEWLPRAEAARINRRPSTQARDESYYRSLVLPTFGAMPIGAIQPLIVQEWVSELANSGYASATIRKAYQLLCRTFDTAVETGLIARSPCRGVRLPTPNQGEMRFLSPAEIGRLAEAIEPRFQALVLTGAYSGARFGELAGLEADKFEPDRRTIRIERTLSEVNGHIHIGEPKTRAARRKLILPSWLTDVLTAHLDTWPPNDNGLVFTAPGGGALRRSFRSRYWKPAVKTTVGEPMRFHDLRHSHVALLIEQGTHPAVIASRLGHTSVRTVLDVYGHLYEGLDRGAADSLESPWDASEARETPSRKRSRDRGLEWP
ncbi:MAG: site-specific integrase [Acidimicrobiia bacterium]